MNYVQLTIGDVSNILIFNEIISNLEFPSFSKEGWRGEKFF
jgi:hypothetical protein